MKRLFTCGCSYTIWHWPTWADYIGVNFDAYYNFARSGSDNKNILYNVLNANEKFNFTKDDTIIVMFTSFNRCSYFKQYELFNSGDLVEQQEQHPFMNKYPYEAGIYDSWLSAKSIKNLLDGKGVNYHLQQALPYDFLWENKKVLKTNHSINYSELVLDYLNLLDSKVSLDGWVQDNYDFVKERVVWQDTNTHDGHPTMRHHLDFVEKFFPQYYTEKAIDFYDVSMKHFTYESQYKQGKKFKLLKGKYDNIKSRLY